MDEVVVAVEGLVGAGRDWNFDTDKEKRKGNEI
jgi:hypothetical protein